MKKLLKKTLLTVAALFSIVAPFAPAVVYAAPDDAKSAICEGLNTNGNACDDKGNDRSVQDMMRLVLNMFSFIVGFAAIIMIIIGGFRYVISAGDGSNTAGAKNTILYAIIGLVVVALAQIIVRFVLKRAT